METKIGCHKIDRLILPTVFHDSADMIAKVLKSKNYDVALAIGQAGGRSEITPERVGINIDDARIKDNQGHQPIDQVIRHDGAPAYFSNLPIKRMTMAIQKVGLLADYLIPLEHLYVIISYINSDIWQTILP